LASSRGTLNGPDLVDVHAVLIAFEHINSCRLRVELFVQRTTKMEVLQMKVSAFEIQDLDQDPKLLVSHQSTIGFGKARTMDVAILQALYKLDADLANLELAKAEAKKA